MSGQVDTGPVPDEDAAAQHGPLTSGFPPSLTGRFLFWLAVVTWCITMNKNP